MTPFERSHYLSCIETARGIAQCSRDRSVRVGAALIPLDNPAPSLIVEGYNDFPDGVIETDVRRERPTKYLYTEHAERAALYKALRTGVDLTRYMIAVTQYPCADCARGIILSGIELVVVPAGSVVPTFKESSNAARKMFAECGVEVIEI